MKIERIDSLLLDEILTDTFGIALEASGFEQITPRKWVRSNKNQIRDLLEIQSLKGGVLSPRWGFSLDYVPHVSGSSIRWHRTAKSAIFDVCFDPIDENGPEARSRYISRLYGATQARKQAKRVQKKTLQEASGFWQRSSTLAELPQVFEFMKARPATRFGFYNYVQHPLAYAFTLARLGEEQQAREELGRYLGMEAVAESTMPRLLDLFDDALNEETD